MTEANESNATQLRMLLIEIQSCSPIADAGRYNQLWSSAVEQIVPYVYSSCVTQLRCRSTASISAEDAVGGAITWLVERLLTRKNEPLEDTDKAILATIATIAVRYLSALSRSERRHPTLIYTFDNYLCDQKIRDQNSNIEILDQVDFAIKCIADESDKDAAECFRLRSQGCTIREIAEKTRLPRSTVFRKLVEASEIARRNLQE